MAHKIEITLPRAIVEIASRGQSVELDLSKLAPEILQNLFAYGVQQKISDAASTAGTVAGESHFGKTKGEVTGADWKAWADSEAGKRKAADVAKELMGKAVDTLYAGEWSLRQSTGTTKAALDPVSKLAHDMAKAALMVQFKAATKKSKIADMREAHKGVAAYFTDKNAWVETQVAAWIKAQADAGKADYMAMAQEQLEGLNAAAEEAFDF